MGVDSGRDIHHALIPAAVPPFASREPGRGTGPTDPTTSPEATLEAMQTLIAPSIAGDRLHE